MNDMNLVAALATVMGALIVAGLIMAYPSLRRRWRGPARLHRDEARTLIAQLPWRNLLDARQRARVIAASARLLADVRFVGCNGLEITRTMQLVIAGHASMLCLGAQPAGFALPGEILIYPDAFYIPRDAPDEYGLINDLPMLASGEAWQDGRVILSWSDIEQALAGAEDNVVVHEFAHLLDFAAPDAAGAPPMTNNDSWSATFTRAYESLRADGSPVIDMYGAENPTEFFAVTVEAFFQRGAALRDAHDALYRLLAAYFDLDTAARPPHFTHTPERADPDVA